MATILIALMIVGTFAIVAYPYFAQGRAREATFEPAVDPVFENLVMQRDATYAAIKDLEFDHAMCKLSDADYTTLRAKYETKAVAILQDLDGVRASQKQRTYAEDAIEREVQQLRAVRCPKCGTRAAAGDRFCAKCGTPIKREA